MPSDPEGRKGEGAEKADGDGGDEIARKRDEFLSEARRRVEGRGGDPGSSPRMMGLGIQFVVAILLCLYAGQWLDRRLGTGPWLLVLGVFVGASAGFYAMYRALVAEDKRLDERKRDGK